MSRKIYVAARFQDKTVARAAARVLRAAGHTTVSHWHESDMTDEEAAAIEERRDLRRECAMRNYDELRRADTLVVLVHKDCRGALAELVWAYCAGHQVLAIGDPFAVTRMVDLPQVKWFGSVADVVEHLGRL